MDANLLGSICNQLSWPELVQLLDQRGLCTTHEYYDQYRNPYLEVCIRDPKIQQVLHEHWPQHQLAPHTWRL
jgi:hypothetical protein